MPYSRKYQDHIDMQECLHIEKSNSLSPNGADKIKQSNKRNEKSNKYISDEVYLVHTNITLTQDDADSDKYLIDCYLSITPFDQNY